MIHMAHDKTCEACHDLPMSDAETSYPNTFKVHRTHHSGDERPGEVWFVTTPECLTCGEAATFEEEAPYEEDPTDWAHDHVVNCPGPDE